MKCTKWRLSDTTAKVAVIGPHANATKEMVGNYLGQICPYASAAEEAAARGLGVGAAANPSGTGGFGCVVSPLAAIAAANAGGATVFAAGCAFDGEDTSGYAAAVAAAVAADYVVVGLGITQAIESESHGARGRPLDLRAAPRAPLPPPPR
jgi:hypothetical protein